MKKIKKLSSLQKKLLEIKHTTDREDFLKRCLYRKTKIQDSKYNREKEKRKDKEVE